MATFFGAAERQPATLMLVKTSKSPKMVNSKDKVDFLVLITFFFNLEPFIFYVHGDLRARPRFAVTDSVNLRAISADKKQKKFLNGKKNPHAEFQPSNISDHNSTGI